MGKNPNPQQGYKTVFRWCGFCGEARYQTPDNLCLECHRKLRGRKRTDSKRRNKNT